MTFLSFNYLLLLGITFCVYYYTKNEYKHLVLFFASVAFISFISINALLFSVLFSILNYLGGIYIYKYRFNTHLKKITFWILIALDIGILALYKYINFLFENINSLLHVFQSSSSLHLTNLILPIGISYYTFQSIGYLIRINREFETPEKNFINFCTFLIFFPKFIAGPVERSNHFLPQIKKLCNFDQVIVSEGLRLFLFGAFKKIIIADNLYVPVSLVYSDIHTYSSYPLIFVLCIQSIYVYCDFSGYTDMALGSAKILGINLIPNFNRPFLAKSITEFWKRWHISLSAWCNEFIYLSFIVKYRKLGTSASILGIFLTFITIGIWHGANWKFVVLGLLQSIAITYEFFTKKYRLKLAAILPEWLTKSISRILVYFYMSFSMIFFFSNSTADAIYFISNIFTKTNSNISVFFNSFNKSNFTFGFICFLILFAFELMDEKGINTENYLLNRPVWIRWSLYYLLIALIFLFNPAVTGFVYQKF